MNSATVSSTAPASLPGSGDLVGLAAFGKVAFALLVIIAMILVCAWLLRRLGPGQGAGAHCLKVISARAVGAKEKVVIVEVEGRWLVLGVTAGGISKLHELPAGEASPPAPGDSFAKRFAAALKHNARGGGDHRGR